MKKSFLLISILLLALCALLSGCGESESKSEQNAGSLDAFTTGLESQYYVQEGTLSYLDTIDLASKGELISCFGNNAGSGYLVPMLPPAPNQDPAPATTMGPYSWPAEEASVFYDASAENEPANPYFSPVGWTYKLRQDEAVVIIGSLPPECKYFSLINYVFSSPVMEGKTYTERSFFQYGDAESGVYHPIFGSLGAPVNMNNIQFEGEGTPFGNRFVYIASGNQTTAEEVRKALISAGYDEAMINVAPFYADTLHMGLDQEADVFNILMRTSQPADQAAFDQWVEAIGTETAVYRITPVEETTENAYPYPNLAPRGTGTHEVAVVPDADQVLDEIRANLIAEYGEAYTYEEFSARIAVAEGVTNYLNDANGQGDNRDTSYLMTDDFVLNSDEDFVVIYGVNHAATGKATYANTVLYARPMLNGVVSLYDSMYAGSADKYLQGEGSENYYVVKMARTALDDYTAVIPYSTGNPNGKFYGVDNGSQIFLAYRAYVEPATGVGPSYYEIVYDRAIVFHKK